MCEIMNLMTSNTYKVLKQMYSCQITLPDGTTYIPLSQAELSRSIGVSTITMNKIFKELDAKNLLHSVAGKRGKYQLTDTALLIIKNIAELENKLGEVK